MSRVDGGARCQSAPAGVAPRASSPQFASQPAGIVPVLLTEDQSAAFLGISPRKFAELRAESFMPDPIVLGPRLLRWSRTELEAAIANMPRQKMPAAEPLNLAKARASRAGTTVVS